MLKYLSFSDLIYLSLSSNNNISKAVEKVIQKSFTYLFPHYENLIKILIYKAITDCVIKGTSLCILKNSRNTKKNLEKINEHFKKFGYSETNDIKELLIRLYYVEDRKHNQIIINKINQVIRSIVDNKIGRYYHRQIFETYDREFEYSKLKILEMNMNKLARNLFIEKFKLN